MVTMALATSSEHIHEFAKSKFRNTNKYHRFSIHKGEDIRLFDYQRMEEVKRMTQSYLRDNSTVAAVDVCVSQLRTAAESSSSGGSNMFSNEHNFDILEETVVSPELLDLIQQQPVEDTFEMPPESFWSQSNDYKIEPTKHLDASNCIAQPFGHLTFAFTIFPIESRLQSVEPIIQRYQFPPNSKHIIPNGRWKASMVYTLKAATSLPSDSTPAGKIGAGPALEGSLEVGLSISTIRKVAGSQTIACTSTHVDISNISACWELLEHSGSFDFGEEDQPLFELWWDLAQVSEELASRLTLSFGGIRY